MKARKIIEHLGGIRPTASKLGTASSTVQGWKERDQIPLKWKSKIVVLLGSDLSESTRESLGFEESDETDVAQQDRPDAQKKRRKKNASWCTLPLLLSLVAIAVAFFVPFWQKSLVFPHISANEKTLLFLEKKVSSLDDSKKVLREKISALGEKVSDLRGEVSAMKTNERKTKLPLQQIQDQTRGEIDKEKEVIFNGVRDEQKRFMQSATKNISKQLKIFQRNLEQKVMGKAAKSHPINPVNVKRILLQQMLATALSGESFAPLLKIYQRDYSHRQKNTPSEAQDPKGREEAAYATLQKHSSGIKTRAFLKKYLENAMPVALRDLAIKNAKKPLDKVVANVKSLINIQDINVKSTTKKLNPIESLMDLLNKDKLETAIALAKTYNIRILHQWIRNAQKRLETLQAFDVLIRSK